MGRAAYAVADGIEGGAMYIGGGVLVTVLIVLAIIYLARRV